MQPHAEAGGEPRAVHRRTHQPFLRGLAACVEELLAPAKRPAHHLELLAAPVEAGIKQLAGFGLAGFGQAMLEDDVDLRVCADVALEVAPEGQRLDIRPEERRVWKGVVETCRSRWSPVP